jgi:carbonic anhydrase
MYFYNLGIYLFAFIFLFISCNDEFKHKSETPLQKLEEGNQRFINGAFNNNRSGKLLEELSKGQHPYAVVVSCSDSRISPNVLFDTDLGDLFIIRTAGNIIGEVDLASIEYAVEHLNTPLIVVLGHTNCGAIEAFLSHKEPKGHIKCLMDSLKSEPEEKALEAMGDKNPDHYVRNNIIHQANYILKNSEIIKEHIKNKKLIIKEALLDTKTGKITFN